jgi:hypothetical protein
MKSAVEHALDELVHQFGDPLAFLRELVQNAIDAGSEDIEVTVELEREGEGGGAMVVSVRDFGEGMTRAIIEQKLTRLFSSAKDGDETKIGKFGIGFVSVFAIDPAAVVVDTGREGESWRIVFDRERRYRLRRMEEPFEGTCVRVYKTVGLAEFEAFRKRAREVVAYWCRHTDRDIRFDGEPVNQPFDLATAVKTTYDDGFSRMVVGHLPSGETLGGYYNQGLTLVELRETAYPGVAYKVSSPHLEHTLTRDNLIRDAGYERIENTVREVVHDALLRSVFVELERAVLAGEAARLPALWRAAAWHVAHSPSRDAVLGRAVVQRISGRPATLRELVGAEGPIVVADEGDPIATALEEDGVLVVRRGAEVLLEAIAGPGRVRDASLHFVLALAEPGSRTDPLVRAIDRVLDGGGLRIAGVHLGRIVGAVDPRMIAIAVDRVGKATPVEQTKRLAVSLLSRRRALVVDAQHPTVVRLRALAAWEPEIAALQLAKLFLLGERLDARLEGKLVTTAYEERCRRSTS